MTKQASIDEEAIRAVVRKINEYWRSGDHARFRRSAAESTRF